MLGSYDFDIGIFCTGACFRPLSCPQGAAFSLQVRDHTAWGVSLQNSSNRPGVDPFVFSLAATTVACNEMLHDGAGRAGQGGIGVSGLPPPVPPTQVRGERFSSVFFSSVRIVGDFVLRVFFFFLASWVNEPSQACCDTGTSLMSWDMCINSCQ